MDSIRNIFKNDNYLLPININNSEKDKQKVQSSNNIINKQNSTNKIHQTQSADNSISINNDEENLENDDCFIKFGYVSPSKEKTQRINNRIQQQKASKTETDENEIEQDQPAYLVEEIDAITSLIIYDSYSKRHEFTFSPQHRAKIPIIPKYIYDDIDRFDAIYSCLINQFTTSQNYRKKKFNFLNNKLRSRFLNLSDINLLKNFQQNEQTRIYKEKMLNYNRVPFIPNILSYERTCPYYNLDELKWIRNHLC